MTSSQTTVAGMIQRERVTTRRGAVWASLTLLLLLVFALLVRELFVQNISDDAAVRAPSSPTTQASGAFLRIANAP